jgi:CubicO group peptidase (beta-lactamase class C family)
MRNKLAVAALALSLTVGATAIAWAQPASIPDTPAARHLTAFIEAFNTGNREAWTAFINAHYRPGGRPLADRLDAYDGLFADFGGFDLQQVVGGADPLAATGVCKVRNPESESEWMELTLLCDSLPPHLLIGIRFEPGLPPIDLPQRALYDAEIDQKLRELIGEQAAGDRFSGAVLIARGDKIIAQGAWGEASQRYHVPNNIDTKFNLGSMNKMFTALAIGQLVEQGKLRFDTKLGDILPDYPDRDAAAKVTVGQLLSHTSGIGDFFSEEFDRHAHLIYTLSDFLPFITDKPLAFEPGAQFSYSNGGFIVLGLIIEKVSGQNYFDYIREHIYKPAGMVNSDHYDLEIPVENLAIGYTRMSQRGKDDGPRRENYYRHPPRGGGSAGGGYSTVIDLHHYALALAADKLVSRAIRDSLWSPHAPMGPDAAYGYGFGIERADGGHRNVGHNGGAPGINASFRYFPELDLTIAALANYDMAAENAARIAMRLALHGLPPVAQP